MVPSGSVMSRLREVFGRGDEHGAAAGGRVEHGDEAVAVDALARVLQRHRGHRLAQVVGREELAGPLVAQLQFHEHAAQHVVVAAGVETELQRAQRVCEALDFIRPVPADDAQVFRFALVALAQVDRVAQGDGGHADEVGPDGPQVVPVRVGAQGLHQVFAVSGGGAHSCAPSRTLSLWRSR